MDESKESDKSEKSKRFLALVSFGIEIHGLRDDKAYEEISFKTLGSACLEEEIDEEEDITKED